MLGWVLNIRKMRKGNRKNIPAIKDCNWRIITVSIEKFNSFYLLSSTVISSEDNIPHIQEENIGEPFSLILKSLGEVLER
jgi:hypothetical protein